MPEHVQNNFAIQKLNRENYEIWKIKAEFLLINNGLWDAIGEEQPTEDAAKKKWIVKDKQARAMIGLLVEDSQLLHVRNAETALEAWNSLKAYHQKATLSSKVSLLKQIFRLTLEENGDMESHINTIFSLLERLSGYGEKLKDCLIVAIMLGSLPPSYGTLITALESRDEKDLTIELVKGKLLDEAKRRNGADNQISNSSDTAMKVFHQGKPKDKEIECYFCKEKGHLKRNCKSYKKWKANKERANKISENSKDYEDVCFMMQLKEGFQTSNNLGACYGLKQAKKQRDVWIIDSGATSHMANSRDFFEILNSNSNDNVRLANGELTQVQGVGSGTVKVINSDNKAIKIKVENVLYVPSLESNLLSVRKLTEKGFKLEFKENRCDIIHGREIKATAKEIFGLYELQTEHKAYLSMRNGHKENCQHTWHKRFGHRDVNAIKDLEVKGLATGIKIVDCGIRTTCECCIEGKMTRKPFPKNSQIKSNATLDLIHTDVCGPMQVSTPSNKRYILTIIDDFSRYTHIFLLEYKSETKKFIKEFVETMKTAYQKKPKIIRSDRGREYIDNELTSYLKSEGIQIQYTTTYTPEQNGVAERKNRSLIEMARSMLFDAGLPKKYWGEAINTANFLQNRLPSRSLKRTPFEIWYNKPPDVKNLQIFGCTAYAHIPKEKRQKMDKKAQKLLFVGYSNESKGYRLLDKDTDRIKISRDVIFVKDFEHQANDSSVEITLPAIKEQEDNDALENGNQDQDKTEDKDINEEAQDDSSTEESQGETSIEEVRRSKRNNRGVPPVRYMGNSYMTIEVTAEPKNRQEALSGPYKREWKSAMDDEMKSLTENNTWELVPKPKDRDVISCKWVFKIKKDSKGNVSKFKARLVARGFSQKYGVDYNEVFAPVVRHSTFRLLLTIAGKEGLIVVHYDAKTAFLNGIIKEDIYMRQPEGYAVTKKEEMVCKLNKSIYGLKQAARAWNDLLKEALEENNFKQSQADPCFYICQLMFLLMFLRDICNFFLVCYRFSVLSLRKGVEISTIIST